MYIRILCALLILINSTFYVKSKVSIKRLDRLCWNYKTEDNHNTSFSIKGFIVRLLLVMFYLACRYGCFTLNKTAHFEQLTFYYAC